MKRVILLFIFFDFIGSYSQEVNDFTVVKDHIIVHSKKLIKSNQHVWSVSLAAMTRELEYQGLGNKEYINISYRIKRSELLKYRVVKEKDSVWFPKSVFYARFGAKKNRSIGKDDWAGLVEEIKIATIPERLLVNFELANYYWERKEIVKAEKAYKKFAALMKFEGLNEQIPKLVRERLFKCRYRK